MQEGEVTAVEEGHFSSESIEYFIEAQANSPSYDLAPLPPATPFPVRKLTCVYLSQSSCVSPVQLTDERGERGWGGAKGYDERRGCLVICKSFNTLCFSPKRRHGLLKKWSGLLYVILMITAAVGYIYYTTFGIAKTLQLSSPCQDRHPSFYHSTNNPCRAVVGKSRPST